MVLLAATFPADTSTLPQQILLQCEHPQQWMPAQGQQSYSTSGRLALPLSPAAPSACAAAVAAGHHACRAAAVQTPLLQLRRHPAPAASLCLVTPCTAATEGRHVPHVRMHQVGPSILTSMPDSCCTDTALPQNQHDSPSTPTHPLFCCFVASSGWGWMGCAPSPCPSALSLL